MLRAVRCDDCKACLTSSVMLSTNAFIYFKEYKDDEQSLTYPSERLVETVSASVTVLESMMVEVPHTHIQLKRKLKLPSRTLWILVGFSLLVVRFTTKK